MIMFNDGMNCYQLRKEGERMRSVSPAVKQETTRIASGTAIGVVLMWVVFFFLHQANPEKIPFDYTVFLGGAAGGCVAVLNFFFHGTGSTEGCGSDR